MLPVDLWRDRVAAPPARPTVRPVTTARHGLTRDVLTADQQAFVVAVARFVEDLRKVGARRRARWLRHRGGRVAGRSCCKARYSSPRVTPEEHDIPPLGIPERDIEPLSIEPLSIEDAETPAVRGLLAAGTATFSPITFMPPSVVLRRFGPSCASHWTPPFGDIDRRRQAAPRGGPEQRRISKKTSWLSGVTGA
jgi:hypothetical protein